VASITIIYIIYICIYIITLLRYSVAVCCVCKYDVSSISYSLILEKFISWCNCKCKDTSTRAPKIKQSVETLPLKLEL
jgi:hypothetical protein